MKTVLLLVFGLPSVCGLAWAPAVSTKVSPADIRHPNIPGQMLMKTRSDGNGGLKSTKAGGTIIDELVEKHEFTPLERIFLTLSGNVQTAFSSYYLQEITVEPSMQMGDLEKYRNARKKPLAVLERTVYVKVAGLDCFKVTAIVKVYDQALFDAYTSQNMGLDQLLKMFNSRPEFALHDAGRRDDTGGMWRFYTLECHKGLVDFDILEEFQLNAWDLPINYDRRVRSQIPHPNFPDRMLTKANDAPVNVLRDELTTMNAGGNLIHYLSDAHNLTPLERVAITSNGSLQMCFSSYYLKATNVAVLRNEEIEPAEDDKTNPLHVYDRVVYQTIGGEEFNTATSIVRAYDEECNKIYLESGIGNLLRVKDLNPEFVLHDAGRADDGGMWRYYSMNCEGVIEFDILEEFPANCWDLDCMPEKLAKLE